MSRAFGPRRAAWVEVDSTDDGIASSESREIMTRFDLIYRSIVATQFNFHQSGHPGMDRRKLARREGLEQPNLRFEVSRKRKK